MHRRQQVELDAEERQEDKPIAKIGEKQPVVRIRDIADSLKHFSYEEFYSFFSGIACAALVDKLLPIENFLSGIIGCRMVPVDEFLKRTAVPEKLLLDAPKAFSIDSFREIFLEKMPSGNMKFPQGVLNGRLVCMLVPWASVVDARLSMDASMEQFRKAESASQKLKKAEPGKLNLTSDKLVHTTQLLDSILQSMEVLHKCQKVLPSEAEYSKDEVKRFHDLSTGIVRTIIQTLGEIQETELSCEVSSAVATLKKHLTTLQDAAETKCSGLLVKLLEATHAALSNGKKEDCRDRVDGDPKKFFPCIAEPGADFIYTVLTSLIALKPTLTSCLEKLIKAASHPCLANINDGDLNKVKDTLLNEAKALKDELDSGGSGSMAVTEMVLADLIASSSLLTAYCFVLHCL